MREINDRIRKVVEQSGLNKSAFAKKINVTPSHISQMCSGSKMPSDRTIADICREFGVNETWLRAGEGEPYIPKDRETRLADAVNRLLSGENPEFKRRLILVLSALDESQWAFLEEKLLEIVGGRDESAAPPPKRDAYGWTDEEYHAELQRQLDAEKGAAEKSSDSGFGNSGAAGR